MTVHCSAQGSPWVPHTRDSDSLCPQTSPSGPFQSLSAELPRPWPRRVINRWPDSDTSSCRSLTFVGGPGKQYSLIRAAFTRSADIVLGISAAVSAAAFPPVLGLSGPAPVLIEKHHYLDSFTGTFVNPNTAATYFGALTLLSLALMSRPWSVLRPLTFLRSNRRCSLPDDSRQAAALAFYAGLAFIFALALFSTRFRARVLASLAAAAASRRGSATFLIAASQYSTKYGLQRQPARDRRGRRPLRNFRLASHCLRIQTEGLVAHHPLCTYRSTRQAIKEHVPWGTGAGTFQDVFPA